MIRIASGARHDLSYVAETTAGTTPVSPQMALLGHTSCSLSISRDTFQSQMLRSDRQIPFVRTGADKVSGSIGFELLYGEYDPLIEAALGGTWTEDVLKVGTEEKSFTLQRAFSNITQYGVYRGCFVNQMSLSIKPNAMITGSFEVTGMSAEYRTSSLHDAPKASLTSTPFDSFTGSLKEGGTEIAAVTGLDITLANGIEPQFGLFSKSSLAMPFGRSNMSGTLTAFFTNGDLLNKFLKETPASLECTMEDLNGNTYTLFIPSIVYTGADNATQNEGVISLSMPWQAVLDTTTGTNFQITRKPKTVVGDDSLGG